MSVNESASIVKFHVVEFTAVMLVKGVPLSILYCADPEISLSKVAVMIMLSPAPRRLSGWATESVNVTRGVQDIPHRGKKLGREFTGAERLKFSLLGLCSTHQHDISESNADASLNILFILEIEVTFQPPIGWLKLEALKKALIANVTLLTSHPLMSPLNADAKAKAAWIVSTFEVSQFIIVDDTPEESPLLKIVACANISWRLVRLEVFQLEISWLNTLASLNILAIVLTLLTFQFEILQLNAAALLNISSILVTMDVFHWRVLDVPVVWPLLNATADINVSLMFVTLLVSQEERSWLNKSVWLKAPCKVSTLDVFQLSKGWLKASAFLKVLFM